MRHALLLVLLAGCGGGSFRVVELTTDTAADVVTADAPVAVDIPPTDIVPADPGTTVDPGEPVDPGQPPDVEPADVPPPPEDPGPPPGPQPGALVKKVVGQPLADPASVRSTNLAWDSVTDVFVNAFGWVGAEGFRTRAAAYRWTGSELLQSTPIGVDGLTTPGQNSLEREIAAASGLPESLLLIVTEDDRLGNGNGKREIFGQFVKATPAPGLELIGTNVDLSEQPDLEEYGPCAAWESGRFMVAWADEHDTPVDGFFDRHIYSRTCAPDGTKSAIVRLGSDADWQNNASCAAAAGTGKVLVVWSDYDPLGGNDLDAGYDARVVDAASGQPASDVLKVIRFGNQQTDRPDAAWSPARQQWLVVWMKPFAVHGSWVGLDGTLGETGFDLATPEDGAGAARLARVAATGGFAVAYHSWQTSNAYLQELDGDAKPAGERQDVNASTPPLGTFWNAVAASGTADVVLVAPCINYAVETATLFAAP